MSEFSECLKDMRDHYKTNISAGRLVRYAPSDRFSRLLAKGKSAIIDPPGEEVVAGLKLYTQSLSRDEASTIESDITAATQALKDANVTPEAQTEFQIQIEKLREKAKTTAEENIDKLFDEALAVGEANPEYQETILSVMEDALYFINDLYDRIASYVQSIVASIAEWAKTAWENIKTTFNDIGSWVSGWFS